MVESVFNYIAVIYSRLVTLLKRSFYQRGFPVNTSRILRDSSERSSVSSVYGKITDWISGLNFYQNAGL